VTFPLPKKNFAVMSPLGLGEEEREMSETQLAKVVAKAARNWMQTKKPDQFPDQAFVAPPLGLEPRTP
jgi:hypothetical protein